LLVGVFSLSVLHWLSTIRGWLAACTRPVCAMVKPPRVIIKIRARGARQCVLRSHACATGTARGDVPCDFGDAVTCRQL
jgi:hypothetical protein